MPAATIIGTTKGTLGVSETQTGIVFETCDYSYNNEKVPFPDRYGATTAVAYLDEKTEISLKGYMVAGATWNGTLASTMTLSGMPPALKAGNTGGSCIFESIKISDASKNWRSIELGLTYYPNVV